MLDILIPMILIAGVFGSLALLIRWTRALAELLWHLTLAPIPVFASVVVPVILISTLIGAFTGFPPYGPAAMTAQLIITPFAAVPIANWFACLISGWTNKLVVGATKRNYIYDSARLSQREAYESLRIQRS
jgi:hypothetical protein